MPEPEAAVGAEMEAVVGIDFEVAAEVVEVDGTFVEEDQMAESDTHQRLGTLEGCRPVAKGPVVGVAAAVELRHDQDPCILVGQRACYNLSLVHRRTWSKGELAVPKSSSIHFGEPLLQLRVLVMWPLEAQDLDEQIVMEAVRCRQLLVEPLYQPAPYTEMVVALAARRESLLGHEIFADLMEVVG